MDNKKLGIIVIIIGVLLVISITSVKVREDNMIRQIVSEQGTCFLEDGTCLHDDRDIGMYIASWVLSAVIIALGLYLALFEKSQAEVISALENQKKIKVDGEKFDILMKGLDKDEKVVMKAVKEQDGITQQTLRLRTDMHKSKLSIVLGDLEKKDLIKRIDKGKTKQVFLKVNL